MGGIKAWNVLILGAGNIGSTAARMLAAHADYRVTLTDTDEQRLEHANVAGVKSMRLDVADQAALDLALHDHDAVLNALPFSLAKKVAGRAAMSGTHYFDLTEDVATTHAIKDLAALASTVLMPQCGLAPGFVGIVAHDLARRFDQLEDLNMRVGALPRYPINALKYNLTWSTAGLINEYCNPCEVIADGRRADVPALEGYETFALDGVDYEAFNTSGGLGTLCSTLMGRVRNLNYKSIRYPGHCDIMRLLLNDLRLRDRRELLREIFETAIPTTAQDVVLVFVNASGYRRGVLVQEAFSARIHGGTVGGASISAIQLTTAAGACTAIDLVRDGVLPQRGFVSQEAVPLDAFRANRFGACYFEQDGSRHNVAPQPAVTPVRRVA